MLCYTNEKIKNCYQQRFCEIAKYVVNSRLSFARNLVVTENTRLRSSPLRQAAKRCVQPLKNETLKKAENKKCLPQTKQ